MPTSWNRTETNSLRAHLQEALWERASSPDDADRCYSDYDIAAIRAELEGRQPGGAQRSPGPQESRPDHTGAHADLAIDRDRVGVLIARCFKPSRRAPSGPWPDAHAIDHGPAIAPGPRGDGLLAQRLARLQRLL